MGAATVDRRRGGSLAVVWSPSAGQPRDLVVPVTATTTVAELAVVLDASEDGLIVDGRARSGDLTLTEAAVRRGSVLQPLHAPSPGPEDAASGVECVVVVGLLAGERFHLAPGSWVLGRGADCDLVLSAPSISVRHALIHVDAALQVDVEDIGATNGVRVDGRFTTGRTAVPAGATVQLGAIHVTFCQQPSVALPLGEPQVDGTAPLNRPPRQRQVVARSPLRVPSSPLPTSAPARLPWIALTAPLLLSLGMALFYDPRFAAFALLSPIMMLGTWLEDRRRLRRDQRDSAGRRTQELEVLAADIETIRAQERAALQAHLPAGMAPAVVEGPQSRLWERRPPDADFLHLTIGHGRVHWEPDLGTPVGQLDSDVQAVVERTSGIDEAPIVVAAAGGSVLGVAGRPDVARAVARSLVIQATTLHGPADLAVAVLGNPDAVDWQWVRWLPHSSSAAIAHAGLVAGSSDQVAAVAEAVTADGRLTMLVIDDPALLEGRDSVVRPLLSAASVTAIVCATAVESLPAACTGVVTCLDDQGAARFAEPGGRVIEDVLLAGMKETTARQVAVAMARYQDPELHEGTMALPTDVSLIELLPLPEITAAAVARQWNELPSLRAPIGVTADGPLYLDLAHDGPHGLIAGTTGAGKSELLRTIVAGLAASAPPSHINFVLIDYKGGSAFDACAGLPHTVGVVTDLDSNLSARALRCLEAELRYRECLLRNAGVADLDAYRAGQHPVTLPRLLVAVDEFATLAAELPDFIDRLVGVAQRGRSLGVHLLLATQRPAGAVSDAIRANTNARVALRVQDAADSTDVIGSPIAAHLNRRVPGRAYLRCGPGELTAFQTARVSGITETPSNAPTVQPFGIVQEALAEPSSGSSDLQRLVEAAAEAFAASGAPEPRRPWPEPLPAALPLRLSDCAVTSQTAVIGVVDDPDAQTQRPYEFGTSDAMVLYGALGAGPTSTLATIALSMSASGNADCYVVDAGAQTLQALDELPSVGGVVRAGDRARQERLVQFLADELSKRRTTRVEPNRTIVVLIDNYAGFAAGFDDLDGFSVLDTFARIVADGPAFGIVPVLTADRINAVPAAIASTVSRRLLFRLADPLDAAQLGIRADAVDSLPSGRAIDVVTGLQVQFAAPADPLDEVVSSLAPTCETVAAPLEDLPSAVPLAAVVDVAAFDGTDWFLPLGLNDRHLRPAGWRLGAGDHALVTGPARSGKSSVLVSVAETLAKIAPGVPVYGVALRRSPLQEIPSLARRATSAEELADLLSLLDAAGPAVLLVDDADVTDDTAGTLARLVGQRRDDLWCVAAGRADVLRMQYSHWTSELRRSRIGLALRPNAEIDGDLWHTPLPRRHRTVLPPGRGYLIADGACELVQAAMP